MELPGLSSVLFQNKMRLARETWARVKAANEIDSSIPGSYTLLIGISIDLRGKEIRKSEATRTGSQITSLDSSQASVPDSLKHGLFAIVAIDDTDADTGGISRS